MIIDASAIVAILAGEPEADELKARWRARRHGSATHPVSLYEATLALARLRDVSIETAADDIRDLLDQTGAVILPVDASMADAAAAAFDRYGKGRHPARLNMGDCFSYACAKLRGVPLLYKGDDFAQTDLA